MIIVIYTKYTNMLGLRQLVSKTVILIINIHLKNFWISFWVLSTNLELWLVVEINIERGTMVVRLKKNNQEATQKLVLTWGY